MTKYIPIQPTPTQTAFLLLPQTESLFGGAAGGGKSLALLAAALQYVDCKDYHALILRRTFPALAKPGALIDVAHQWLQGTDAQWNEVRKQWTFPTGATLSFGYLENETDKYQYQGSQVSYCAFDELTQFSESQYRYLFSRMRRGSESTIPIRMRAASNPGGVGHEWVKRRFLTEGKQHGRIFIPSTLNDNPYLDVESYRATLAELHPIERRQLEHGDWDAKAVGEWFKPEWFRVVDTEPIGDNVRWLRHWDLASTQKRAGNEPDYTVGTRLGMCDGVYWVADVVRFRDGPAETTARIAQVTKLDGRGVEVSTELEPGAASKMNADSWARTIFAGYSYRSVRVTGDKALRAKPFAAAAANGLVRLVRGPWITAWLDELSAFPTTTHDDQVDSASGAFSQLFAAADRDAPTRIPRIRAVGLRAEVM